MMERPAGAQEKEWGWALELSRQMYSDRLQFDLVLCRTVKVGILAGGYSSIHRHVQSHNFFCVLEGELELRRMRRDTPLGVLCSWKQQPNDRPALFPAGEFHQFEAITDVIALEIYIAIPNGDASELDIERLTKNGRKLITETALPKSPPIESWGLIK